VTQILIGILEDDEDQSALLELWLQDVGYSVQVYKSGVDFVRAVQKEGFDILLLDWNVPEMTGFEVLEWVRSNMLEHIPVIFLTTRGSEENVIAALQSGADDYVSKPARPRELIARVEALARRSGLTKSAVEELEIGNYRLNRRTATVEINAEDIPMTRREFDIAWFLFNNLDKVLSRDSLLKNIWNINSAVQTRTVDTHISRVRSKLGLRPENGWQLTAVYHYGYRLERVRQEDVQD
jgi:DNA-binding response OmpR family regulator